MRYDNNLKFMRGAIGQFITLIKKNPLALAESLFRFSSVAQKDNILCNYEKEEVELIVQRDGETNLFND